MDGKNFRSYEICFNKNAFLYNIKSNNKNSLISKYNNNLLNFVFIIIIKINILSIYVNSVLFFHG